MTPQDHDSDVAVTITGRDVWDKLVKIELVVTGIPAIVADHETRIRALQGAVAELASANIPARVSKMESRILLAAGFVLASGGTGAVLAKVIGA